MELGDACALDVQVVIAEIRPGVDVAQGDAIDQALREEARVLHCHGAALLRALGLEMPALATHAIAPHLDESMAAQRLLDAGVELSLVRRRAASPFAFAAKLLAPALVRDPRAVVRQCRHRAAQANCERAVGHLDDAGLDLKGAAELAANRVADAIAPEDGEERLRLLASKRRELAHEILAREALAFLDVAQHHRLDPAVQRLGGEAPQRPTPAMQHTGLVEEVPDRLRLRSVSHPAPSCDLVCA